jgi:hypothetical protein
MADSDTPVDGALNQRFLKPINSADGPANLEGTVLG